MLRPTFCTVCTLFGFLEESQVSLSHALGLFTDSPAFPPVVRSSGEQASRGETEAKLDPVNVVQGGSLTWVKLKEGGGGIEAKPRGKECGGDSPPLRGSWL